MTRALVRHAAFFAAGLLATAAQALLLRELVVDAAGDEAAIGVGLAAWLTGIALGAALARHRAPACAASDAGLGIALLATLPPLGIVAGRLLVGGLAPDPGELPGLGTAVVLALATLLPGGAAVGWAFTALASAASRVWAAAEGVTRVYVIESLGSLAGGLLVTALALVLPLRLSAAVSAGAAAFALVGSRELLRGRAALVTALALCAALAALASPIDAFTQRVRFAATAPGVPLLAAFDTPYQHLAIAGDEVRVLYASGQLAASFPDPYAAESLGSLVAVLVPRPGRVLLFGEVERGLVPVLLRDGAGRSPWSSRTRGPSLSSSRGSRRRTARRCATRECSSSTTTDAGSSAAAAPDRSTSSCCSAPSPTLSSAPGSPPSSSSACSPRASLPTVRS